MGWAPRKAVFADYRHHPLQLDIAAGSAHHDLEFTNLTVSAPALALSTPMKALTLGLVRYGTVFWGAEVPGTSCQATITLSLRDENSAPRLSISG